MNTDNVTFADNVIKSKYISYNDYDYLNNILIICNGTLHPPVIENCTFILEPSSIDNIVWYTHNVQTQIDNTYVSFENCVFTNKLGGSNIHCGIDGNVFGTLNNKYSNCTFDSVGVNIYTGTGTGCVQEFYDCVFINNAGSTGPVVNTNIPPAPVSNCILGEQGRCLFFGSTLTCPNGSNSAYIVCYSTSQNSTDKSLLASCKLKCNNGFKYMVAPTPSNIGTLNIQIISISGSTSDIIFDGSATPVVNAINYDVTIW
jgi:hypothetical protein